MKVLKAALIVVSSLTTLSACQHFQTWQKPWQEQPSAKTAQATQLSCGGVPNCSFERVNQWQGSTLKPYILEQDTQMSRARQLFNRMRLSDAVGPIRPTQTLRLPAAEYEVVIQFYPISPVRAEVFHVIHRFEPKQHYVFKMYRQRDRSVGTLLNVSTPDPLCIDMLQNNTVTRRFCRPFNPLTGSGEYIEQKL